MSSLQYNYEVVIGLEIHAQLATYSKVYSSDSAEFGASPNTHVSVVSLGHPGSLPVLNEKAVDFVIRMGLATHCEIRKENQFARKNYFYADLPKGYQITQHTTPICFDGFINLSLPDGKLKKVGITRIHLEEDAGKSLHDQDLKDSLIDLNRAGVPLIEIVSEPDIRSSEEAGIYLSEIRKILRYLEICDGNMEEGSMRCDANISVRKIGELEFGNRSEVKNLNSIRNVQKAIDFEAKRQVQVLENGGYIDQNTLNFDALTGVTSILRSKEMSNDYRYFPEPDLPPLFLTDSFIENIRSLMPKLPEVWKQEFINQHHLSKIEANYLVDNREIAEYYSTVTYLLAQKALDGKGMKLRYESSIPYPKLAYNWITGSINPYLNEKAIGIKSYPLREMQFADFLVFVDTSKVNHTILNTVILPQLLENPTANSLSIAEKDHLLINANENEVDLYIETIIKKYPEKVLEFQAGKKGIAGLFMGEIMKLSKGKIDPKIVNTLLMEVLESHKIN